LVSEPAILSEAKNPVAAEESLSLPDSSAATHLQNDSQRVCWKFQTHFLRIALHLWESSDLIFVALLPYSSP
ncbi:MAG: hypothetical protein MK210_11225, partial [Dehalococcoidia bacterium]|nr:hypothetical protein [Dehalococcoidia bacterium]